MTDIKYDGFGFNAAWIAGFKSLEAFQKSMDLPGNKHLLPGENRADRVSELYHLVNPKKKQDADNTEPTEKVSGSKNRRGNRSGADKDGSNL